MPSNKSSSPNNRHKGGKGGASAKKVKKPASAAPFASKTYCKYGAALYGKFVAHADKQNTKRVFYVRYKEHKGPKIERVGGELCFVHPDNKKNKFKATAMNFTCGMLRARHDYELARGKQPNMAKKGCGAKEGFHKNVKPNNVTYNAAGEGMARWKTAAYWGDNKTRGTSGTVNEKGYDFIAGKIVMADDDGYAYDKHDCDIADVKREVHDLCDSGSDMDEGDEEVEEGEEEDEDSEAEEEEDEEEEQEQEQEESADETSDEDEDLLAMVHAAAHTPAVFAKDLTVKQIKGIVKSAAGSNKNAVQLSALERGSLAALKKLHQRVGLGTSGATDRNELAAAIGLHWGL